MKTEKSLTEPKNGPKPKRVAQWVKINPALLADIEQIRIMLSTPPPEVRKKSYPVPCIIWSVETINGITYTEYTPVINHPHSDKENGQSEQHYHIDDRFSKIGDNNKNVYRYRVELRPVKTPETVIKTLRLQYIHRVIQSPTHTDRIKHSRLKHDCMKNGKCPHRGMDLTGIKPDINGVITCPLHSLKFDAKTKQLIKRP